MAEDELENCERKATAEDELENCERKATLEDVAERRTWLRGARA